MLKIDRGLPWVFWERLLGSGALTANGDEAVRRARAEPLVPVRLGHCDTQQDGAVRSCLVWLFVRPICTPHRPVRWRVSCFSTCTDTTMRLDLA